jgi:UDP-N-acetyl-D-glucosamine dehydrogenase
LRAAGHTFTSVDLTDAALKGSDAVVIVTDHDSVNYQRVVDLASVVVDARNATKGLKSKNGRIVPLSADAA